MSEKVFKMYALPNHPVGAADYVPPETTDELEAEWRQSVRGKNAVIAEEQAMGTDVARRTLEALRESDDERIWARLVGGAMLMSSNYLFRSTQGDELMYRNIRLPHHAHMEGRPPLTTTDEYDDAVETKLQIVKEDSFELADNLAADTFTKSEIMGLSRTMGELGVILSNYPFGLDDRLPMPQDLAYLQAEVRRAATRMHDDTIRLARDIGVTPSVAQFARTESPLGAHIVMSRRYPTSLVRSFKDAQEAVEDENRMVVG